MTQAAPRRGLPPRLLVAVVAAVPGLYLGAAAYLGLPAPNLAAPVATLVYGLAIVGAAFVLSWASEAAQVDLSAGLALALLALVAVLPEYAVDFVFSFQAGQVFAEHGSCAAGAGASPCGLALANMTGANRVLVGVGWPLVLLVATLAVLHSRRRGGDDSASTHVGEVRLQRAMSVEVVFLAIATCYSLTLPLRSSLTLVDAAVLVAIFVAYAWRLSKAPAEEPELRGVAKWAGEKPRTARRATVVGLFVVAGLVILATAEHFADGLVQTGTQWGADQFILVQWVAPLASESPELIVACLYAWRLKASDSLGALLSSKVNQWTLLVGTIPVVFALSSWSGHGLPLDGQQRVELLLTAAQSLFAVSTLVSLRLDGKVAALLFVLFAVQFLSSILLPGETNRTVSFVLAGVYVLLAVVELVRHRGRLRDIVRDGVSTPLEDLSAAR
ncbi:sodium:proton exchanger [Pseudonocardia spinosispora]|uniref:sodium:proton exchanger n=1 Tax=Pseudonocardia spinosispora TaxID=103441 RepID=UPI00041B3737|nr:sodium:proton exchanger [Pseudonocardia spinosispora]